MPEQVTLSVVIPCFNEEKTLEKCVTRVLAIADESLRIEMIIVDDASTDASFQIAQGLKNRFSGIQVLRHPVNMGKGAALRSGFRRAGGDFVAVQDADLEYNPADLKKLLKPLREDRADVVFGSRFISGDEHRVLYFWHSLGNRFLTFLSNMFTDLNLSDMETCYKVFRRDVIQGIEIRENRFGFEPEIVARVAHLRLRIFEMGVSYSGRTYEEGKKIGVRDGFRAIYCIFRYNAHRSPLPVQFLLYTGIGGVAALANLMLFALLFYSGVPVGFALPVSFGVAALINYLLCISLLFRHAVRWQSGLEMIIYGLVVTAAGVLDWGIAGRLMGMGLSPMIAKAVAIFSVFLINFFGRRFFVFPEPPSGEWKPQIKS